MHTKNILNLFEEFLYIINDRYSEVICAKYGRSRVKDACTISLADFASLPAKVVWLLVLFSNSRVNFCMTFMLACSQLTSHGVRAKTFDVHKSKVG